MKTSSKSSFPSREKFLAGTVLFLCLFPAGQSPAPSPANPSFKKHPVDIDGRRGLTRDYCKRHYGLDTWKLIGPKMIVVHYTAIPSLSASLRCFESAVLPRGRKYIDRFGRLNVGVHFVVGRDGAAFALLPEDMIGRHAIGYNHIALGIEMAAGGPRDLTPRQLEATTEIVAYLAKKYPSVEYCIGHHEYTDRSLPHYRLFLRKDASYRPTVKSDPGREFMKRLRARLLEKYSLALKE